MTLSTRKSPLAGMGAGQKIATIALAVLALIALLAVLVGGGGGKGGSSSPSSGFSPASYSDGSSNGSSAAGSSGPSGSSRRGSSHASPGSSAHGSTGDSDAGGTISASRLPAEAVATLKLIDAGGPFPYSRDGIVFSNREGRLPQHPRGWYHEYTVKTPGESDRGARRLIQGKDGIIYYTDDHYVTFRRVSR